MDTHIASLQGMCTVILVALVAGAMVYISFSNFFTSPDPLYAQESSLFLPQEGRLEGWMANHLNFHHPVPMEDEPYAESGIGWVSLHCNENGTNHHGNCDNGYYGVEVDEDGILTGRAWAGSAQDQYNGPLEEGRPYAIQDSNITMQEVGFGWISFSREITGPPPDGFDDPAERTDGTAVIRPNGDIEGWARMLNACLGDYHYLCEEDDFDIAGRWSGWIQLNPNFAESSDSDLKTYEASYIDFDTENGDIIGGSIQGYAWNAEDVYDGEDPTPGTDDNENIIGVGPIAWDAELVFGGGVEPSDLDATLTATQDDTDDYTYELVAGATGGVLPYSYSFMCDNDDGAPAEDASEWTYSESETYTCEYSVEGDYIPWTKVEDDGGSIAYASAQARPGGNGGPPWDVGDFEIDSVSCSVQASYDNENSELGEEWFDNFGPVIQGSTLVRWRVTVEGSDTNDGSFTFTSGEETSLTGLTFTYDWSDPLNPNDTDNPLHNNTDNQVVTTYISLGTYGGQVELTAAANGGENVTIGPVTCEPDSFMVRPSDNEGEE